MIAKRNISAGTMRNLASFPRCLLDVLLDEFKKAYDLYHDDEFERKLEKHIEFRLLHQGESMDESDYDYRKMAEYVQTVGMVKEHRTHMGTLYGEIRTFLSPLRRYGHRNRAARLVVLRNMRAEDEKYRVLSEKVHRFIQRILPVVPRRANQSWVRANRHHYELIHSPSWVHDDSPVEQKAVYEFANEVSTQRTTMLDNRIPWRKKVSKRCPLFSVFKSGNSFIKYSQCDC